MEEFRELRVAGNSPVKAVAGSITKCLDEVNRVEVTTIGASACSQCVKGIAMARGFIATKGRDLIVRPGFATTEIDGKEKTCLKFIITVN